MRQAWCGASVILPKEYLRVQGGFDERYFLYYEDTDLALRGGAEHINPILVPTLRVFHDHSASTNKIASVRSKSIWRSRGLFVAKNFGIRWALILLMSQILRMFPLLIRGKSTFNHVIRVLAIEHIFTLRGLFAAFGREKAPRFYDK